MKQLLTLLTASLVGKIMCDRKWETCSSIFCRTSFCHSILAVLFSSALMPLMLVPPRVREFSEPKLLAGRQHADGKELLTARSDAKLTREAFPGLWTWGGSQFDNVRIFTAEH